MGITPPYLAGREGEQAELLAGLERLRTCQPMGGLILSAPRGVDKTVLLDWLAAAEPTEAFLHDLNANQIPNVVALGGDSPETAYGRLRKGQGTGGLTMDATKGMITHTQWSAG